jgi:hypothetical protein
MMWILYNVHRDLYWNEQQRTWGPEVGATLYSTAERDKVELESLHHQWRPAYDFAHADAETQAV